MRVWETLLAAGQPLGIKPCGLRSCDTLRIEDCYRLYGHELDEDKTPIEVGTGFFVSLDKGEFIGRSILAEQKTRGVAKKWVGFKMTEKSAPPRSHYPIWGNGTKLGTTTSGTLSPSLGIGIGLRYVPPESAKRDTTVEIEIGNRRSPAAIVSKPIVRRTEH